MERSKQNKHNLCDKDNNGDNSVDNVIDDAVDGVDDNVDACADKHNKHLSQVTDCNLMERSKQNKHIVCNEDNDGDNGVDNSVDNSVDNGVDGDDARANKHLTYLS
eukprot:15335857-Ditylum_brightwellii.AAC.1